MAAASIGQVHRAVLPNGRKVAVKVQRPDAARQIEADLVLLYQAAKLVKERVRALDFIDARALVDEFARSIRQGARLPPGGPQRRRVPPQLRGPPAHPRAARLLELHARPGADDGVPRRDQALGIAARLHGRGAPPPRVRDDRGVDADDLQERVLPRRPASGEHPRARPRADRPRRLRPGGEALGRRHVEAHSAVHRRRERADRVAAAPPRRSRCALSEGSRGGVHLGVARDLLPLLRREPFRDRSDPGHSRGLSAHLFDEPAPADAVRAARQGDRHPRLGGRRPVPGLQRLRGREAVRAQASGGALHAAAGGAPHAPGDDPAGADPARRRRTRSTTSWSRSATVRSRSDSCTRASTTSCRRSTSGSTGS